MMISRIRFILGRVHCTSIIAAFVAVLPLAAQQQAELAPSGTQNTPAASQNQAKTQTTDNNNSADPIIQPQTSPKNDRLFYALPNYLTVENASQAPPLTPGQKYKLVAEGSFDPVEYPFVGIVALIGQGRNDQPSFGQGFKGYSKRYAVDFTDNTVGNFMANATVPWLLKQDPRYFQLGKGSFIRRAAYAASRIVITRDDSGRNDFNYSEFAGNGLAALISNLYHPREDRTVSNNISVWWTEIAWDAAGFELKEFWPNIKRHLHKSKPAQP